MYLHHHYYWWKLLYALFFFFDCELFESSVGKTQSQLAFGQPIQCTLFSLLRYTQNKCRTAWQPEKLLKITKNHKTNDDESSGVIDTEDSGTAGQRDSRTAWGGADRLQSVGHSDALCSSDDCQGSGLNHIWTRRWYNLLHCCLLWLSLRLTAPSVARQERLWDFITEQWADAHTYFLYCVEICCILIHSPGRVVKYIFLRTVYGRKDMMK